MFYKNRSGQFLYASLVNATDGSAITSGATIEVAGGGTAAAGAGTLMHLAGSLWSYSPTQAETNFDTFGYAFEGTNVTPQGGTIVTATPYDGLVAADASSGASTVQLGSEESSVDDDLNGVAVMFDQAGAKMFRTITDYVGSTKVATLDAPLAFGLTANSATYSLGTPSGAGGGGVVTGYAVGQEPETRVLVTPANRLATDGSGRVTGSAALLDAVMVEAGINARQALAIHGAVASGQASGFDPNNLAAPVTYFAMGTTTTARVVAVCDASGNRSITLHLPS